jgi:hypothetical protein
MAVTADTGSYTFPPPPSPDAIEWEGSPIGAANVITRTRGRTQRSNKTLDSDPQLRDSLVRAARGAEREARSAGTLREHDVIVHGVRVRALTNSEHLIDYWRDNWYDPGEWAAATAGRVPEEPRITVYAFGGVPDQEEAAYYSRETDTVLFFNTAYYGQLKSWVLGAVGRVLANDYGIHSIHGACVDVGGSGVIYIAPTGTGKSTSSYGLMSLPDTLFHSDDWVYVHYTCRTRAGESVSPFELTTETGELLRGYRCLPAVFGGQALRGEVRALRLSGEEVSLPVSELDRDAEPEAYAYISEKVFYLRTNLLESFPTAAPQMVASKLENVPEVGGHFVERHAEVADRIVAEVIGRGGDAAFDREQAARLFVFDNSRAMLDIAEVFGADKVYSNPMQPVRLANVFLLKRDLHSEHVLERLAEERFMNRLILGVTPGGKREVAYNAYRAVDDAAERAYVSELERGGSLWPQMDSDPRKPQSLDEEFSLFSALYRSAACYDLNTVLTKDPQVTDKAHAVELTIRLIASTVQRGSPDEAVTLSNYRDLLEV